MGRVHPDVVPPQRIYTVEHTPWQVPAPPVPRALVSVATEMVRQRLDRGVLEYCNGLYRNPWFLVAKKATGQYRLINNA